MFGDDPRARVLQLGRDWRGATVIEEEGPSRVRDATQAARAGRAFLGLVALADLWTKEGSTEQARALRWKPRRRTRRSDGSACPGSHARSG